MYVFGYDFCPLEKCLWVAISPSTINDSPGADIPAQA